MCPVSTFSSCLQKEKVVGNAWSATLNIGSVGMSKLNDGAGAAVISTPNIKMKLAKFESEEGKLFAGHFIFNDKTVGFRE